MTADHSSNRVETVYLDAGEYVVEGSIRRADLTGAVHAIPNRVQRIYTPAEHGDQYREDCVCPHCTYVRNSEGLKQKTDAIPNHIQEEDLCPATTDEQSDGTHTTESSSVTAADGCRSDGSSFGWQGRATRNVVAEWCREDLPNGERCGKPAEFILWGKLFPNEGLGPRCYDHAAKHAGHRALGPGTVEQYAIYVLPRPS